MHEDLAHDHSRDLVHDHSRDLAHDHSRDLTHDHSRDLARVSCMQTCILEASDEIIDKAQRGLREYLLYSILHVWVCSCMITECHISKPIQSNLHTLNLHILARLGA